MNSTISTDNQQNHVLFSHELPFLPDDGQIIYVEDKPCLETRGYIEQNLGTIQEMFRQRGFLGDA